jgi:hypothetical protein
LSTITNNRIWQSETNKDVNGMTYNECIIMAEEIQDWETYDDFIYRLETTSELNDYEYNSVVSVAADCVRRWNVRYY